MMGAARLVMTGAGVVAAAGIGLDDFLDGLGRRPTLRAAAGVVGPAAAAIAQGAGVAEVTEGGRAIGIADFDPRSIVRVRGLRSMSRTAQLACAAGALALADAGLDAAAEDAALGLVGGTVYGNVDAIARFDREVATEGPRFVDAMLFPNTVLNSAAGFASIALGLRALNSTVSAGAVTGLAALAYAGRLLRRGRARVVLAGAYEEFSPWLQLGLGAAGRLAPPSSGAPQPYGRDRAGTVPGEGAAFCCVELDQGGVERARPGASGRRTVVRGLASAYAPVALGGGGAPCERGDGAAPAGDGVAALDAGAAERLERAYASVMHGALEMAGITPAELGGFLGAASGAPDLDRIEWRALAGALGQETAARLPLLPLKAVLGETSGAHAALALAAAHGLLEREALPEVAAGGYALDPMLGRERLGGPLARPTLLVGALDRSGAVAAAVLERQTAPPGDGR